VPDLLCRTIGDVMPQATGTYDVAMMPAESEPSCVKASWKRSRCEAVHSGHWSTTLRRGC
jgi:hypothetical protein